jgi:hypothetical protein
MADDDEFDDDDEYVPSDLPGRKRPKVPPIPSDAGPVSPELIQRAQLELLKYGPRGLKELLAEEAPEPWLDDLLYPMGLTLVAGEANAGKGWLALRIAVALLLGEPFLTGAPIEPRCVLYLNPERDPLGPRLRAAVEHHPGLHSALEGRFIYETPSQTFGGQGTETLRDYVGGLLSFARTKKKNTTFDPKNAVLILDPLRPLLTGNENSSDVSAPFFAQLRQVNAISGPLPGAPILLMHHMGWQDTQLSVARERGSSDIRAAVDVTYTLQNQRQVAAHAARKEAQNRGEMYAGEEAPARDLLLLLPHKHRLVAKRHQPYVLELVPTATLEPTGKYGDAVWMQPAPDVRPEEVTQAAAAAKTTAKASTLEADAQLVLAALKAGAPGTMEALRSQTQLPRGRVEQAMASLLMRKLAHRNRYNGPLVAGPEEDDGKLPT